MKITQPNLHLLALGCLFPAAAAFTPALAGPPPTPAPIPMEAASWKEHTISPVANFAYFEDPVIRSEIRPVFIYQNIKNDFVTAGGDAYATGVQVRYAVTDRLGVFMRQGGYLWVNPELGNDFDGWADLGFGLKYAVIDSEAHQFILTPGVSFVVPTGEEDIFHGRGDGEFDFFLSAAKGFGDFHLTANGGFRVPIDSDVQSTVCHYSLQADYYVSRWFIPFAFVNGWTVVDNGNYLPLNAEGYDLFNFGAMGADGSTQVTVGGGLRIRVLENVDLGVAYERSVNDPKGYFDDRFTFDVSIRF